MSSQENLAEGNQCSYCREFGQCRIDPRTLPCNHSFCLPCITADFKRTGTVTCPTCRVTLQTDKSLAELPQAVMSTPGDLASSTPCDSCAGVLSVEPKTAVIYCQQCLKSFCEDHLILHSQLLYDHQTVSIEGREDNSTPNGFYCFQHTKYLYIVGCLLCERLYCNMCLLTNPNFCFKAMAGSSAHKFGTIEKVVSSREVVRSSIERLEYRVQSLNSLVTDTDKVLKLITKHQEKSLEDIYQAYQEQVKELEKQYLVLRNALTGMTSEAKSRCSDVLAKVEEEETKVNEITEQLKDCLNASDLSQFLQQRGPLLTKARKILEEDLLKLESSPLLMVKPNENAEGKIKVKLAETDMKELAAHNGLSTLHMAPTPLTSQQAPYQLVHSRSILLYKSNVQLPQVLFCTHEKAYYSLAKGFIWRYQPPLTSEKNICTHADDGVFIKAREGKIYTRQSGSSSELVNIYPIQEGLVSPKLRHHQIKYEEELLPSFALIGDEVVFCESCEHPRLIIFSSSADSTPRVMEVQFGVGVHHPIFIGDGPPGYVTLICKEWVELQRKTEELRLISLKDGATVWKYTLQKPANLVAFPKPVIYHNGYLLLVASNVLTIINSKTGKQHNTKPMRSPADSGEYAVKSVSNSQLCSYTDTELLLFESQLLRVKKNATSPEQAINLSLFEICTAEHFV